MHYCKKLFLANFVRRAIKPLGKLFRIKKKKNFFSEMEMVPLIQKTPNWIGKGSNTSIATKNTSI